MIGFLLFNYAIDELLVLLFSAVITIDIVIHVGFEINDTQASISIFKLHFISKKKRVCEMWIYASFDLISN